MKHFDKLDTLILIAITSGIFGTLFLVDLYVNNELARRIINAIALFIVTYSIVIILIILAFIYIAVKK